MNESSASFRPSSRVSVSCSIAAAGPHPAGPRLPPSDSTGRRPVAVGLILKSPSLLDLESKLVGVGELIQASDRNDGRLDLEGLGKCLVDAVNGNAVKRLEGLLKRRGLLGKDLQTARLRQLVQRSHERSDRGQGLTYG